MKYLPLMKLSPQIMKINAHFPILTEIALNSFIMHSITLSHLDLMNMNPVTQIDICHWCNPSTRAKVTIIWYLRLICVLLLCCCK